MKQICGWGLKVHVHNRTHWSVTDLQLSFIGKDPEPVGSFFKWQGIVYVPGLVQFVGFLDINDQFLVTLSVQAFDFESREFIWVSYLENQADVVLSCLQKQRPVRPGAFNCIRPCGPLTGRKKQRGEEENSEI